jgi:hypothetical protein
VAAGNAHVHAHDDERPGRYQCTARIRAECRNLVKSSMFQDAIFAVIIVNSIVLFLSYHDQNALEGSICQRRCDLDASLPANASAHCTGPLFNRTWYSDGAGAAMPS